MHWGEGSLKKIQINVKIIHQFNYLRKWRWEFLVLLMTIMERRKGTKSLIECMWGDKESLNESKGQARSSPETHRVLKVCIKKEIHPTMINSHLSRKEATINPRLYKSIKHITIVHKTVHLFVICELINCKKLLFTTFYCHLSSYHFTQGTNVCRWCLPQ